MAQTDEYEYQYDGNETETFFVDLDLSSLTGAIKSRLRKTGPSRRGTKKSLSKKTANPDDSNDENSADEDAASPGQADAQAPGSEAASPSKHEQESEREIQILDLDTANPIVSYQDQMYSCTWTDMIGTNMFFTRPSGSQSEASLLSSPDFDLIGTSHIKLVGQKAKLVPKTNRKRERSSEPEDASESTHNGPDATSFPGFTSSNWRTNIERRKQASFLDRLSQAKRARGDNDIVTTLSDRSTNTIFRSRTADLSAEEKLRIRNLSDRIVKGDARAVTSLKEMYSQLDTGDASEPDPDPNLNPRLDGASAGSVPIPTPNPQADNNDQEPDDHG